VDSQDLHKGKKIERPKDPTKDGYIFDAWYIDNGTFNFEWNFNNVPTEDMTLYAKWIGGDDSEPDPTDTEDDEENDEEEEEEIIPDPNIFYVANLNEWNDAVSTINERGAGDYQINVIANFSMNGVTGNTFGATDINVTVKGSYTISLNGTGSLLRIGNNQTVTMRDLVLRGSTSNDASLVYIDGGAFKMESGEVSGNISPSSSTVSFGGGIFIFTNGVFNMSGGAVLNNTAGHGGGVFVYTNGKFNMSGNAAVSGNTATDNGGGVYVNGSEFNMSGGTILNNTGTGDGGGVYVVGTTGNNGTFTMNDGKVSGNTAYNGGGVAVSSSTGTFIMNGGEVSGNEAANDPDNYKYGTGGGVLVYSGTFLISNGIVYGNDVSANLQNTSYSGAALGVIGSTPTAQYGTFINGTWTPATDANNGKLSTTNNTIKVVNGDIVP